MVLNCVKCKKDLELVFVSIELMDCKKDDEKFYIVIEVHCKECNEGYTSVRHTTTLNGAQKFVDDFNFDEYIKHIREIQPT